MQRDLHESDFLRVQQCLDRQPEAIEWLMSLRPRVENNLFAKGVRRGVDEVVADIWGELLERPEGKDGRLHYYKGRCSLLSFLTTITLRKWYDWSKKYQPPTEPGELDESGPIFERRADDHAMDSLISQSLFTGFSHCTPEEYVVLILVNYHGVKSKLLTSVFGHGESWVSKALARAEETVKARTLEAIHEREPSLNLSWEDIIELCSTLREELGGAA